MVRYTHAHKDTGMVGKGNRAALYLRVSTGEQTTENQRQALETIASLKGWQVVRVYEDAGISGAKGRDKRPALNEMLKDATRRKFDVVMCWALDRLGRSLPDLLGSLTELEGAGVNLFLHQQAIDTTTPAGRAFYQILGVFAEFERGMIIQRVRAGIERARSKGTRLGRPKVGTKIEDAIRTGLASGEGIIRLAKRLGVGTGTVQRVKAEMQATM